MSKAEERRGPLAGYRVLEMAGIGPGPFCAMMLADMGAEVIRVDRLKPGFLGGGGTVVDRGRRSIALDIKQPGAVDIILDLADTCDALIEGFRPGVMERLGLGPEVVHRRNPRLIYGRMTGWGQSGPLSGAAGHDINYLSITGALNAIGHADRPPVPPLHLLGDIGGGGLMLAFGIVSALLEAQRSGRGQVIDAAICDGVSTMATGYHAMLANGRWENTRYSNMLDGAAPFYGCYRCADGKFVSIGPLEPPFYEQLLDLCDARVPLLENPWDRSQWPQMRARFEALFATRTRDEWCQVLEGTDACFAPVLDFEEARHHPHNVARQSFTESGGVSCPAPAPRFSRTPGQAGSVGEPGEQTTDLLAEIGRTEEDISRLRDRGVIL